jgi:hypothetical protein
MGECVGDVACVDVLEKRPLADLPTHRQFTVMFHMDWKMKININKMRQEFPM